MSDQRPRTPPVPHAALPIGEGAVPDKVLEELLAAFAGDDTPAGATTNAIDTAAGSPEAPGADIDLDDPSIDALLGIESTVPATDPAPEDEVVTTTTPVVPAAVTDEKVPGDRDGSPAAAVADLAAGLTTEPVPSSAAPLGDTDGPPLETAAPVEPEPPVRKPIQIGGSDDDLIDAVYLDEEGADRLRGTSVRQTEASVERTTILIGDDEIEGSSGGIPIATGPTSMDPRLRARRIAVRRAVGRRRLKWFVIGGVAVLLVTAVLAVLGSSLFEVKQVSPSGVSPRTAASYDAAVARIEGHPVLLVDTHAIESQLEKNPWIREARVTTDFPDSASIEIVERVPIATYVGADTRWRIIDVDGVIVDVIANRPLAFMPISGPGAEAEAGGSAGDAFRHAAELVEALSPAARSRTESVVVSDTGELSLQFESTTVVLGAPENLLDKLTWLEALLQSERSADCAVINVTTRDGGCVRAG